MAGETFQLRFKNNENVTVSIDEPINFATVDFQLSQKDKGYGRDVSFNGGEVQFEFVKYRNHYLDKLLVYNNTYGFESIVELIITCGTVTTIIGELDFATAITDDLEYFKCKVIQQSSKQIVKRRKAVKVDLLSDRDVDGSYIAPLVPENTLLISKPIYAVSKWEAVRTLDGTKALYAPHYNYEGTRHEYRYITNPIDLKLSELENALTLGTDVTFDGSNIIYIEAATDLKNIVVTIPAVSNKWKVNFYPNPSANFYATYSYIVEYGGVSKTQVVLKTNVFNVQDEEYSFNEEFSIEIPSLVVGDTINIYEYFDINMNVSLQAYAAYLYQTVGIQSVKIEAETSTFNSIAPSFRLVDVMRQVVKSISGLDISAPSFETGQDFYDNRLFNGNSLRAISDKPFYVSLEDLEKSLVELNVDWEIDANGDIFFGTEDDFYVDTESYEFTNTQFSSFNKSFNPRFSINEFNYGYKNFQSLKENEEPNSADVVHGESKWVLGNKMVENKKEISIEWIRDSFLIETNRRKALTEKVSEGTASQDDDKLFAIDTYTTPSNVTIFQKYELLHIYDVTLLLLSLVNDGTINFLVTGINEGTLFEIASTHNANIYRVYNVTSSTIILQKVSGVTTPTSSLGGNPEDTFFNYTLIKSEIPYTNYTDNGFTNTTNLIASDKYSNLRYSIRRNIDKYWKKYLATCNLYHKTQGLSNTWYKNNTDFSSTYDSLTLTEKEVIDTYAIDPILTPFMYNDVIFSNVEFSDFIALQIAIRTDRGYIKTKDNNGNTLKLYPTIMKYDNLSKELNVKGEEKYTATALVQIAPILTTKSASNITGLNAMSGGYIKTNGGSSITAKGVVWSLSANPTIALSTKTNEGSGSVDYKSSIINLLPSKKYYVKSYATNGIGTAYGNEIDFTSDYNFIVVGYQSWSDTNLNVSTYSDGTAIPQVTDQTTWNALTTGAWCYWDNDADAEPYYGKIYNWYAIAGIYDATSLANPLLRKNIAPSGWHIPTLVEFQTLTTYLGGTTVAGGKMKSTALFEDPSTGYGLWESPNTGATNSSKFNALPSGYRTIGFGGEAMEALFWTSLESSPTEANIVGLSYANDDAVYSTLLKKYGCSVRLIKD
jgi:uncharacterized protein (TIGR02145 family)